MQKRVSFFLDQLRAVGRTNMFGAVSYVQEEFPELSAKEAKDGLLHWMEHFGEEE